MTRQVPALALQVPLVSGATMSQCASSWNPVPLISLGVFWKSSPRNQTPPPAARGVAPAGEDVEVGFVGALPRVQVPRADEDLVVPVGLRDRSDQTLRDHAPAVALHRFKGPEPDPISGEDRHAS